jgi:hypothetical protein
MATRNHSSPALVFFLAGSLLATAALAQPVRSAHFSLPSKAVAARARQVPVGSGFRLAGVPLEARTVILAFQRFEVFTPDARVMVHGDKGRARFVAPPDRAYFRGTVDGEPDSYAFLSVGTASDVRGLVESRGRVHVLGAETDKPSPEDRLITRPADEDPRAKQRPAWRCDADRFVPPGVPEAGADLGSLFEPAEAINQTASAAQYSIKVAIETDAEFYSLFNSVDETAGYIGDLMGAISTIYNRDVGTSLRINLVSLWTGGAGSDPWSATDAGAALCEVGGYWAANRPQATYPRAITHFLSGKGLGGGVAWLNVLCGGNFTSSFCPTGMGGGYGVSGNLAGNFNPATPSSIVWDIEVVSHEIGHNFSSPHSHCYGNIPTAGLPAVDQCYGAESGSNCYAGPASLPAGGKGSIMSYCHLLGGGITNISLSFGSAGLFGTQSERIPQKIRGYVAGLSSSCRAIVKAPAGDLNGDGRSEINIYRGGAWLQFPFWPNQ